MRIYKVKIGKPSLLKLIVIGKSKQKVIDKLIKKKLIKKGDTFSITGVRKSKFVIQSWAKKYKPSREETVQAPLKQDLNSQGNQPSPIMPESWAL